MAPFDLTRLTLYWGPGVLILLTFGLGFMRLAQHWIDKSMEMKRQQTESAIGAARHYVEQFLGAQKSQAEALSRLATSVEQRETVESYEHQEILIALKAIRHELGSLRERASEAAHA